MTTTIRKWGNSLGVRISQPVAKESQLQEGMAVEICPVKGGLLIKPVKKKRKYTLKELCAGLKPEKNHPEINWGPPAGKELI